MEWKQLATRCGTFTIGDRVMFRDMTVDGPVREGTVVRLFGLVGGNGGVVQIEDAEGRRFQWVDSKYKSVRSRTQLVRL